MSIKVKLLQNGKPPVKHYEDDLGYDLFIPYDTYISPYRIKMVDLSIQIELPEGYGAIIKDRSSLGSEGIHVLGGVIDNGYRGNIKVVLANLTNEKKKLEAGSAIAQLILIPVINEDIEIVNKLSKTKRQTKGFGSTNR